MRGVVLLVICALVLAGCSGKGGGETTDDGSSGNASSGSVPPLSGWVFDPAVAPVVGANVTIPSLDFGVATDEQGRFAFADVPANQPLLVVVTADGYKPGSKSLQLDPGTAMRLNFTLDRVSVQKPHHQTQTFTGNIDCAGVLKIDDQREPLPCGGVDLGIDERVWEFQVNEGLAGAVIEVVWTPVTPAAQHLNLTIETVGAGNLDEVLFSQENGNILRGQIGTYDANRFYSGGGTVRVTLDIGRNIDDEEAGVGAGLAFQQDFDVFATAFYVEPPPPSFTIADAD